MSVNMQQGILDGLRGSAHDVGDPSVRTRHKSRTHMADYVRNFVGAVWKKLFGVIWTPRSSEGREQLARIGKRSKCIMWRIASVGRWIDPKRSVSHDPQRGAAQQPCILTQGLFSFFFCASAGSGSVSGPSTFSSSNEAGGAGLGRRVFSRGGLGLQELQTDSWAEGAFWFTRVCGRSGLAGRRPCLRAVPKTKKKTAHGHLSAQ